MPRTPTEKILLIGDTRHEIDSAIAEAFPQTELKSVASIFDGIYELSRQGISDSRYTTVFAAAEPIERRPEAAVRTLRELAGVGRLVLFGHSTLELLSRKMLKFGCDDYLVMPASGAELRQALLAPNHRLSVEASDPTPLASDGASSTEPGVPSHAAESAIARLMVPANGRIDISEVQSALFDALLQQPHHPVAWTLRLISSRLSPSIELIYRQPAETPPEPTDDRDLLSLPLASAEGPGGTLHALVTLEVKDETAQELLTQLAGPIAKAAALQARHAALQKMAITDELTGVYNARYFRHFLQRILEKARTAHFPVTLLLFDIDDFKTYNDQFGHQVGDEILKQTATMMKRCTRDHDLVARIGGDEFAVVFWDKEGPRQPREPKPGIVSRPPHSPVQVFERFKRMIQSEEFTALGTHGQGKLGISAGLAVYPYEGHDVNTLIAEADKALMQGSKKHGKNRLSLVGNGAGGMPGNGGGSISAPR